MELLVVFTIVSLVSVLIAQGFGFGFSLYQRVKDRGPDSIVEVMSRTWFRDINRSLVAQKQPGMSLIGDSTTFSAVTMNALVEPSGSPEEIRWEIRVGALYYVESSQEYKLATLGDSAIFQYMDLSGSWVSSWPVDRESMNLPQAIRIKLGRETITVNIGMRLEPNLMLEENLRDRG